jgi:hypothetical protein
VQKGFQSCQLLRCHRRHAAAVHGCYQVCKWLLKVERVPASPVDKFGRTPLAVGPCSLLLFHACPAPCAK